ncbi:hypothetical protein B0H14DRAFT_3171661 [Mycena olivaceomarginata]|nr:hypothetical protein B0H14DRAFT_3171661 [Mycena olivaceomarginata]
MTVHNDRQVYNERQASIVVLPRERQPQNPLLQLLRVVGDHQLGVQQAKAPRSHHADPMNPILQDGGSSGGLSETRSDEDRGTRRGGFLITCAGRRGGGGRGRGIEGGHGGLDGGNTAELEVNGCDTGARTGAILPEEEGVAGSSLGMDGEIGSCFLGASRYGDEGQKDDEEPKAEPVDKRELLDAVERELLDAVEQFDAPGFLAAGPNGDPAGMTMLGTPSPRGAGGASWPVQGAEDGYELAAPPQFEVIPRFEALLAAIRVTVRLVSRNPSASSYGQNNQLTVGGCHRA